MSSVDIAEVQSIVNEIRSALDTPPPENRDGIDFSSLHTNFKSDSENSRAPNALTELDSEKPVLDLKDLIGFYTQCSQEPSENRDSLFLQPKSASENSRASNASTELDSGQPLLASEDLTGFYTQPSQEPSENRVQTKSGSENSRTSNASTELDSEQPLLASEDLSGFYNDSPLIKVHSSRRTGNSTGMHAIHYC